MATDRTRRLSPSILAEDEDVYARLQNIPDYAPSNQAHTAARLQTAIEEVRVAREAEARAQAALEVARDYAVEKEWILHEVAIGVKDQVSAQYGKNSPQVQTIGRKRVDEYKKRGPKSDRTKKPPQLG